MLLLGMLATPLVFEGVASAANGLTVSVPTQATNPVAAGNPTTYTPIDVTGGSSPFYVKLTPGVMPAGASFTAPTNNCVQISGNPATGVFSGSNAASVTAGSTSGTFTVTATEYYDSNCQFSADITGASTFTLSVSTLAVSVPTQTTSPVAPGGTTTYAPITISGGTSGDYVALSAPAVNFTVPTNNCAKVSGGTASFSNAAVTAGAVGGTFTVTATEYPPTGCTSTAVATTTATPTLTVTPLAVSVPTQTTIPVGVGSSTTYSTVTVSDALNGDYVALAGSGGPAGSVPSDTGDGCVLVSAGSATFSHFKVTAGAVGGTFTLTATEYSNSGCTTSVTTATATPTLTVTPLAVSTPTQTTNPVEPGAATTYSTVTVSSAFNGYYVALAGSGGPTGSVPSDTGDGCVLVSAGTATFSHFTVTAGTVGGTFTLTATEYSNSGCTTSVSTATATPTLTVQALGVSVPTQTTNPVGTGGTTTYAPIAVSGGINGDYVKLTGTGLPTGASFTVPASNCVEVSGNAVSFGTTNPASVTAGNVSGTFTVTATEYTNVGCTSSVVATTTATPTLTVQPFAVTVPTQTTNPVVAGGSTTYAPITIAGGNNGDYVAIAASSLPSGATFTPPSSNCVLVAGNAASLTGASVLAATAGGVFTITANEYSNSTCTTLVTSTTATPTLSVTPYGPATQLVFSTQPANGVNIQATGTGTFPVSVAVEDANGNLETGTSTGTVTLSIASNPGSGVLTCSGGLTATVAAGTANFTGCAITKIGTGYKLTATSSPSYTSPSNATSFDITAGAAGTVALYSGYNESTTVGGPFATAMVARVTDADGNAVTGATVTFTAPSTGASGTFKATGGTCVASGTETTACSAVTTSAGLATSLVFTANATAGSYNVAVASAGTTTVENPMTNTVGAASILAFVAQPSVGQNIQASGTGTFGATVAVEDVDGNLETGVGSGTVTLGVGANPASGVLSCAGGLTSNVVAGEASFTGCSITAAGSGYMLTAASSPSYSAPTNANAFNILSGSATQLVFVAQPTGSYVGTAMVPAVTVEVEDQNGNASSSSATIGLTPSASSLSSGGSAVASGGIATFSALTFSQSGLGLTLTATSPGLTPATSATFNVSVLVTKSSDTLTDGATDSGASGMKSVTYYYCAGFSNTPSACGPSNGTEIGSPLTVSPFSVAWSSLPASGAYRVAAVGTNNAGNSTTSATTPVSVDSSGPVGGTISVPNYATTLSVAINSSNFTDSSVGMLSNVITRSSGLSPAAGACPSSGYTGSTVVTSPDTGVASGKCYEYTLTGISNAAQVATVTSGSVLVDTASPVTTITLNPASPNGTNGWYDGTSPTFTLSATDPGGSGIETTYYEIDGGTASVYPGSAVSIPNGAAQTITYWSVDNAGNVESAHTSAALSIDTGAPSGSITAPTGGSVSGSVTVSSSSADSLSGVASAAFQYEAVGGSSWTTIGTDTTSPYSVTWNASALSGQYDLRVVTTDNAGNSTTSAIVAVTVTAGFSGNSNGTQVFPSSSGSALYGSATAAASMSSSSTANTYTFTAASTLSNLSVTLSGTAQSGGSSASLTVTVMKNGAATALTCTIADNATTCTSPGPVSFANGNTMNIETTRSTGGQPSPAISGSWTISHT
jgi:hypothetical protein